MLMQAHKSIWMQQKNEKWLIDDDNGQKNGEKHQQMLSAHI